MRTAGRVLALAALPLLLSGCLWVALGTAAATGLYVAVDDRSAPQIARDASITSTVKRRFIRDGYVKALDINVDTRNNHVTLHGNVPSPEVEPSRLVVVPKPY